MLLDPACKVLCKCFGSITAVSIRIEMCKCQSGETLEQISQRGGGCLIQETSKTRLDRALSILVWLKTSWVVAGGLD